MVKHGVAWRRWKQRLSRYWNSGKSLSEYCREHQLNLKTASKWRLRFQSEHPDWEEPLEIVPVAIPDFQTVATPVSSPAGRGSDSGIRIERGKLRIMLASDFDAAALGRLLPVLEGK